MFLGKHRQISIAVKKRDSANAVSRFFVQHKYQVNNDTQPNAGERLGTASKNSRRAS